MSGRKVTKRKRRASEAASSRWSPPSQSKRDFSCQVNLLLEQKTSLTVATQMEEKKEEEDVEVSKSKVTGSVHGSTDDEFHPKQLQDFICQFQGPICPSEEEPDKFLEESNKCGEESQEEQETIRKVESFFVKNNHKCEELTKNSLRVKHSPFVISSSEKLRQAVESKCEKCGQTGSLEFGKQTEPQTGIVKLEFVCSKCDSVYTLSASEEIIPTRTKPKTYLTNYIMLSFIVCGEYYKDYDHVMGTLGIGHFSEKQWIRVIEWIAPEVEKIAKWSVEQARKMIRERGDQDHLEVMYDGFYLTRGHYSNNSSATMHDAKNGNIIGFAHRTKRGQGANWQGTSGGAESNMLDEILTDVIGKGKMKITKAVMDKDAACHEVLLSRSPETEIVYCGNHTAKTFHADLEKVKKTPCQVSH